MKHPDLWQRISDFSIDDPESSFRFSDRLALENDWTQGYTLRVIEEYKRFIYLCATSEKPITPSDPVDQAWHLHLTYTESYWISLCKEILGREIHHGPTKGGKQEGEKFKDWYGLTFKLYEQEFGTAPPEDIWWNGERRFKEIHFTRVNRTKSWVLPKPNNISSIIILIALCILTIAIFTFVVRGYGIIMILILAVLFYKIIHGIRKKGGKGGSGRSGCYSGLSGGPHDIGESGCGNSGCSSGCAGGGCSS